MLPSVSYSGGGDGVQATLQALVFFIIMARGTPVREKKKPSSGRWKLRNKMNILLIYIFCLPVFLSALPMKDCGSKKSKINFVALNNCQSLPCVIKKGTYANFTVNFTPNEEVTAGKIKVWGIMKPLPPIPFALDNDNLCQTPNISCPLQAGKAVTFGNHLEVKTIYPSISVINKWQVEEQHGEVLFCFEISLQIVD